MDWLFANADKARGGCAGVDHRVQWDGVRKLWCCDVELALGRSYFPFVRLALVRYQPHALADAKISRVVLADFAQVAPRRTASVGADRREPRSIGGFPAPSAPGKPAHSPLRASRRADLLTTNLRDFV